MVEIRTTSLILLILAAMMLNETKSNGTLLATVRVQTANGIIEATADDSGIRVFKGVPFAEPPIGELRWKAPQPVKNWEGVRQADTFGPRPMQLPVFADMNFRSDRMSEDCLYLNVWTAAKNAAERLPVLVYFYGGGFVAGDGSEYRYDGASMARKGIVVVTVNYRLGVFGFFAHPELTQESAVHASGNYGLLDQAESLRWVKQNIAAFGGDPEKITIAGESAGSISVSAQIVSPLSKELISGAIGESGSLLSTLAPVPLAEAEESGVRFARDVGADSLAELRALPADKLLQAKSGGGVGKFKITIDGYFLPTSAEEIFSAGQQAQVPLLVGWNSLEMGYQGVLKQLRPTKENYVQSLTKLFGDRADEALKLYPASADSEVAQAATDLAGDRFIGYGTWKWADLHSRSGGKPVYRYLYARPRPKSTTGFPPQASGAVHSAEIEYALGNLATNKVYAWTPDDYKVSHDMQEYFANFIKNGDPNAPGLPQWPAANGKDGVQVMRLDVDSHAQPETHRERYEFLDSIR